MRMLRSSSILLWTSHAKSKMAFYRLSPMRVRRVLHSPNRVEEGVAPKTIAMMQPASMKVAAGKDGKGKEARWTQEIWVMIQDSGKDRKVISAWRYPGVTKPRGEIAAFMKREYGEFLASSDER
jgi:hypothetical protein